MKMHIIPFCLLQHMVQPKEKSTFLLSSNSHILDHTCRSMVPIKFSHQQYRVQMLPNYYHVLPHTVCYIQYHFWYHIHQFSTYFHVQGHNQFWNVLSSYHWLWQNFQTIFHKNLQRLKNHIMCSLQSKPQGKQMWKYHHFTYKIQTIHGNERVNQDVRIKKL